MDNRKIFIVICLALLAIPFPLHFTGLSYSEKDIEKVEQREVYAFPEITVEKFSTTAGGKEIFADFENWFKDHLSFRIPSLKPSRGITNALAGRNLESDKKMRGLDGWEYLKWPYYQFRREPEIGVETTKERVRRIVELRDFLAEKEIPFMLVLAPNTWDIYPEYLPEWFQQPFSDEQSTVELFLELCESEKILTLDLTPLFLKEKQQSKSELYGRASEHWSAAGAVFANREIIQFANENFGLNMPIVTKKTEGLPSLTSANRRAKKDGGGEPPKEGTWLRILWQSLTTVYNPTQSSPSCLFIHDSFSEAISLYMNHSFSELTYLRHNPESWIDAVGEFTPDIVILEFVARKAGR